MDLIYYEIFKNLELEKIIEICDYELQNSKKSFLLTLCINILNKSYWKQTVIYCTNVSRKFIHKFRYKIDWVYLSLYYNKLSISFIEKYQNFLYWDYLEKNNNLTELLIDKNIDNFNLFNIVRTKQLSESFIKKHIMSKNIKSLNNKVFIYQNLSETFLDEYINYLNWDIISLTQELSESFIKKHKDKVNWYYIYKYQKLSRLFKRKYSYINKSLNKI